MIDMVPKAISLTLVSHSKENLQRELLQELYKPDFLDELLKESEYVVTRRKEVTSMITALNKAEEWVLVLFRHHWLTGALQDRSWCLIFSLGWIAFCYVNLCIVRMHNNILSLPCNVGCPRLLIPVPPSEVVTSISCLLIDHHESWVTSVR